MDALRQELARAGVEVVETHVSVVFLDGEDVFKVKKPVDLGFLDFSTLAKRRAACVAEVELNRRLAPEVYRGVVPVVRDAAGRHRFGDGGDGEAVEWAVHMCRLPEERRGDRLLAAGELGVAEVERIAGRIARFHDAARYDAETTRFGDVEVVLRNVEENFAQTRATVGRYLSDGQMAEVERWQRRFLAENGPLFAARQAAGRVRDGHGDLRLEHVYLDAPGCGDDVVAIDCIEFADRFRFADVCADVAFLAMDLTRLGRADLAEAFLAAYAREADDFDLYPLVDFYESYRAVVRAKVASILADDAGASAAARRRAAAEARRYYLLALASRRRSLLEPALVAVGGVIGSGKSTLARELATSLGAPVVDADRTRKRLHGVAPATPLRVAAWSGPYTPEASRDVYDELLRRAGVVLGSGRSVVLDASFRGRDDRAAARRLAAERGVRFLFVECRAPLGEVRRRLAARERETGVSDGRREILDDFVARFEPVDELPEGEHAPVDTSGPPGAGLARLRDALARSPLATWPRGLTE